jgi:hypothetical protein
VRQIWDGEQSASPQAKFPLSEGLSIVSASAVLGIDSPPQEATAKATRAIVEISSAARNIGVELLEQEACRRNAAKLGAGMGHAVPPGAARSCPRRCLQYGSRWRERHHRAGAEGDHVRPMSPGISRMSLPENVDMLSHPASVWSSVQLR